MKNDYLMKLLNALNSVFWYQGLLDQNDNKWQEINGITKPVYKKDCVIMRLIYELRNKKTEYSFYSHKDIEELYEDFSIGHQYNVIWIILVEMFGNCGTSPRTGWIEQREECADFLELITKL